MSKAETDHNKFSSRRKMLGGVAAVGAAALVGAGAFPVLAEQASPDADLVAAYHAWRAAMDEQETVPESDEEANERVWRKICGFEQGLLGRAPVAPDGAAAQLRWALHEFQIGFHPNAIEEILTWSIAVLDGVRSPVAGG
jgi:hypothetical protein